MRTPVPFDIHAPVPPVGAAEAAIQACGKPSRFARDRSGLPALLQGDGGTRDHACLQRAAAWLFATVALAAGLIMPAFAAAPTTTVHVTGRVAHPGPQTLPEGSRLSDAVLAADVLPEAYPLGAAWLRASLLKTQTRWKAGLVYEIGLVRGQAKLAGNGALAELATQLEQRWRSLPVTGRERDTLLDPRPLEISDRNHQLGDGDRIMYPSRPDTVRVLGAVDAPCTLPFVAMQAARRYVDNCPRAAAADPDWIYVIQPDGRIQRLGVALWNRQPAQPLAPGAVVYVPVNPKVVPKSVRDTLNDDAARFLSTQLLPADAAQGDGP